MNNIKVAHNYLIPDVPLSQYSSWRIGGKCDYLFYPDDLNQLLSFFEQNNEKNYTVLGNCTNVLIRDKGVRGIVILTRKINKVILLEDNHVEVYGGTSCSKFATFCAQASLKGAEFLAGIPGTIGGALRMNAGSFGDQIWNLVEYVKILILNKKNSVVCKKPEDFIINYRNAALRDGHAHIFLSAVFKLKPGNKEQSLEKIREYLTIRKSKQPLDFPSCGSVFKNPDNDYAGRLIEVCGLKGYRIGGASVSLKHANFIINDRHATSEDIEQLISHIQTIVKEKFNVILKPEVHIIGER